MSVDSAWSVRALVLAMITAVLAAPIIGSPAPARANATGTGLVINEVYSFNSDLSQIDPFVELFNPTATPVDLSGWSLQVTNNMAGTPAADPPVALSGVVPPYSHFLVQTQSDTHTGQFPDPDQTSLDLVFSPTRFPVIVLARTTRPIPVSGNLNGTPGVVDAIGLSLGFPPAAWEGSGPKDHSSTPVRASRGACGADTDDNAADIVIGGTPTPANSGVADYSCAPPCDGQTITAVGRGTITGTAGNDVILGSAADDTINGLGGNDTICGGNGDDTIDGGAGDDSIFGGAAHDEITGGSGTDTVNGGAGHDILDGGTGYDVVYGSVGNDSLGNTGGDGILNGGLGADALDGGADAERLNGGPGADTLDSAGGDDVLIGGDDNDVMDGGTANDVLHGGNGADVLNGGAGDDTLNGNAGEDTLDGGTGTNILRP